MLSLARDFDARLPSKTSEKRGLVDPLQEAARQMLEALRPEGAADLEGSHVGWIPLNCCLNVEGQPLPLKTVEDIIKGAIDLSDGAFRLNGSRQRRCLRAHSKPGSSDEDSFYEWHIVVKAMDDEEEAMDVEDVRLGSAPASENPTPNQTPHTGRSRSQPTSPESPSAGGLKKSSMWRALRTGLVVDRFYVQIRAKEMLEDGEPSDVWWLRVKWVPPMLTGRKQSSLGVLSAELPHARRASFNDGYSTCIFVRLQQHLLEARNEVTERIARAKIEAREKKVPPKLGLKLPIMSR